MVFYLCKINDKNIKVGNNLTFNDNTVSLSKTNVTDALGYTPPIEDTWRGIQDNLTSDSIEDSLSAAQGKALKVLVDSKSDSTHKHSKSDITDFPTSLPASDVKAWAKADNKPSYTASEVGAIANSVTHLSGDIATTEKGANNGVATLGSDGKIPSSQLPSYVDDVLEYDNKSSFPDKGESGKIYVDTSTNLTYRWSGTAYVEISPSIAIGETSSTAFAGDKGKVAYDHSQATHARTDATKTEASTTNGNIKINGTETTVYSHPTQTTKENGLYKVTVDSTGHVSGTNDVTKKDITDLGIPESDTWRGIQDNLTSDSTTESLSAAQGKKLYVDGFYKRSFIKATSDWNTMTENGVYQVDISSWGDAETYHGPNSYSANVYKYGLLLVFGKVNGSTEQRVSQIYIPHNKATDSILTRMRNGVNESWTKWQPINSWRGIQNNLTSDSTTQSLSAAQGKALKALVDSKAVITVLNNSDNLNSITVPGFYNIGGGNLIENKPANIDSFGLVVIHSAIGNYYTQILYDGNKSDNVYQRHCNNNVWTDWQELKFTDTTYSFDGNIDSFTVTDSNGTTKNIYVGSDENILLDTEDLTKWSKEEKAIITKESDGYFKIESSSQSQERYGIYQDLIVEPNTDYTVSYDGRDHSLVAIGIPASWGQDYNETVETGRFSKTVNTGNNTSMRIYFSTRSNPIFIKLPKVQKGNKSTTWSVSPKDIENRLNALKQFVDKRDFTDKLMKVNNIEVNNSIKIGNSGVKLEYNSSDKCLNFNFI